MGREKTNLGRRQGFSLGCLAAVLVIIALTVLPTKSRAQLFILRDALYELSPVYTGGYFYFQGKGMPDPAVPFRLSGVRIHERNGVGGKIVAGTIVALLLALVSSDKEYVGSTYGHGYRIDWYRQKTPEELAAEQKARQEAIAATAKNDYQMDVQIYFPIEGLTTGRGFSWSLYPWSYTVSRTWPGIIEFGFIVHSLKDHVGPCAAGHGTGTRSATCRREERERWHYLFVGTPIRFIAPVTRWAYFDLTLNFNYLYWLPSKKGRSTTHDFRALFTLNPIERLFVRGGAIVSGFTAKSIAYTAETGVRF